MAARRHRWQFVPRVKLNKIKGVQFLSVFKFKCVKCGALARNLPWRKE